jgi:dihydrofolate reductase
MLPEAHVFIATSLDGFIADADGGIGWLTGLPVPEGEDHGYAAFMAGIDAILMGSGTLRTVLGFDGWPYAVPVAVLSRQLTSADLPPDVRDRADVWDCPPREALERQAQAGARRVYVDGGRLISACLRDGLITRLTITRVPLLLGRGLPLFVDPGAHRLRHVETRVWAHGFVQTVHVPADQVAM